MVKQSFFSEMDRSAACSYSTVLTCTVEKQKEVHTKTLIFLLVIITSSSSSDSKLSTDAHEKNRSNITL